MSLAAMAASADSADSLAQFITDHPRLFVLTGAGCSTDSGIPHYRDRDGNWKRSPPVQYREFVNNAHARQRYWARSMIGWPHIANAQPNAAHRALARLARANYVRQLVTQNVDGLHQKAGSDDVLDLHGRLDTVECLGCARELSREALQDRLTALNPDFAAYSADDAPDGDATLEDVDFGSFRVPACPRCGGMLKPAVVFFGESVPRARVDCAFERLRETNGMLVVGSSLMVWSGYRFCKDAVERGIPVAAVNLGRTRADDLLALKLEAPCAATLTATVTRLIPS